MYSKGRGESSSFESDSRDKEARATEKISLYASLILDPTFKTMMTLGAESLHAVSPVEYDALTSGAASASGSTGSGPDPMKIEWGRLKDVPAFAALPHVKLQAHARLQAQLQEEQVAISEAKLAAAVEHLEKSSNGGDKGTAGSGNEAVAPTKASGSAGRPKNNHATNANLRGNPVPVPSGALAEHSHVLPQREFIPWSPFSNSHSSSSFSPAGSCGHLSPDVRYPRAYSAVDIVNNWNPDNTEIPAQHYDTLCHFNFQVKEQLALAFEYRNAELPFIVYNVPEIDEVVKKWSDMDYLHSKLGSRKYRSETSKDNHFMYWNGRANEATAKNWKEPTQFVSTSFEDFIETAIKGQNMTLEQRKHVYFRLTSDAGSDWLSRELKFFDTRKSLFMKEPEEIRGIHCRFGMRGVTAETHFDGSRNFAVQLGGMRRWLLFHPDQCENLYLLPTKHPSGRHISFDLSAPVDKILPQYPKFAKLMGTEFITQPGDAVFIPTHWFHHIISLNLNYQCNARSGRDYLPYADIIRKCGF
jgi:hypothetical protein